MLPKRKSTACFSVYSKPDAAVLPRIVGVFSRLGLVPDHMISAIGGRGRRELCIDLQIAGMDAYEREQLATRFRGLIDVELVLTSEKRIQDIA